MPSPFASKNGGNPPSGSAGSETIRIRGSKTRRSSLLVLPVVDRSANGVTPKSAPKASNIGAMRWTSCATAVGPSTTVRWPGSIATGFRPRSARSIAALAMTDGVIVLQSRLACPAHPDAVPSGVRAVSVSSQSVSCVHAVSPAPYIYSAARAVRTTVAAPTRFAASTCSISCGTISPPTVSMADTVLSCQSATGRYSCLSYV